jgi:hypothetical protein
MNSLARLLTLAVVAPVISSVASAAGVLSIEQAQQLSQATGRPILAMAGTKT